MGTYTTLYCSPFRTKGTGVIDIHTATDWVIFDKDTMEVVHESTDDSTHLYQYPVPEGVFESGKTYIIRVRHIGSVLGRSEAGETEVTITDPPTAFWEDFLYVGGFWDRVDRVFTGDMELVSASDSQSSIYSTCVGRDGFIYVADSSGSVWRTDPIDMSRYTRYTGHSDIVEALCWGGDDYLYSGARDNTVQQIDPVTLGKVGEYTGHPSNVNVLCWGGDGYLYSGSNDNTVHQIDPVTLDKVGEYTGHSSTVNALCWGGDGYLYSGSVDNTVRQIDPSDMSEVGRYTGHLDDVNALCWGGDGYLYSGSEDYTVRRIDPSLMYEDGRYTGHSDDVNALCWGGDGYLYSGSDDGTVRQIGVTNSDMQEAGSYSASSNVQALTWGKDHWDLLHLPLKAGGLSEDDYETHAAKALAYRFGVGPDAVSSFSDLTDFDLGDSFDLSRATSLVLFWRDGIEPVVEKATGTLYDSAQSMMTGESPSVDLSIFNGDTASWKMWPFTTQESYFLDDAPCRVLIGTYDEAYDAFGDVSSSYGPYPNNNHPIIIVFSPNGGDGGKYTASFDIDVTDYDELSFWYTHRNGWSTRSQSVFVDGEEVFSHTGNRDWRQHFIDLSDKTGTVTIEFGFGELSDSSEDRWCAFTGFGFS